MLFGTASVSVVQHTPLLPTPQCDIGAMFIFYEKKRVLGPVLPCFSYTNFGIDACDLFWKISPKTRFFFRKNENGPCTHQEVGKSGVFWTTETLAVPKKHLFPDELAYRRQVSKNEGTYMGGIEIGQLPYI